MIRARTFVILLVGLASFSLGAGCKSERQTAVLLTIDYRDVGQVDQFVIQLFPVDRFDDIGLQEVPEVAGTPFTGSESSVLLILPERWADRNVVIQVVAMLNDEGVGQGSKPHSFPKGEVTELTLQLVQGAPDCGNGIQEALEQCDGTDFLGNTCQNTMGLRDGVVQCTDHCLLDVSECVECGNSSIEAAEECDSDDFGGITCADYIFDGGNLRCDPDSCTILTDECIGGCGNNMAEPGETCDGTDFGARTCLTETGHSSGALGCDASCELDRSGCYTCGNGAVEWAEACDGQEFGGETCQSLLGVPDGTLACAEDCSFIYTAGCTGCGDGTVETWEDCDDGNLTAGDGCQPDCTVQNGWSCVGQPSQCVPDNCGNGVIDTGEVCDGTNLDGETCFSRGFSPGSGALTCNAICTALDTSSCTGGVILDAADLQAAVDEAYATGAHQEIAVQGPAFTLAGTVVFDECDGACVGGQPFGVTIRPLGSAVCFTPTGGFPAFDVVSGNNTFQDLCFSETVAAMYFQPGTEADAGGNTVVRNRFENSTTAPDTLIDVRSPGNNILANRLYNMFASQRGIAGISVLAPANKIVMNLVIGPFDWAILLNFVGTTAPTFIDHNSVRITGGLGGGGVFLNNAGLYCYRNNIVYGDGTSTGLFIGGGTVFDAGTNCGGGRALNNVNIHQLTACADAGCAAYCAGSDLTVDLCDLATDPLWTDPADEHLCLGAGGLVDGAVLTGQSYDFNDATVPPDYIGGAPDVGAREAGTSRNYGNISSSCP